VLAELAQVLGKAARVLVLVLHALRPHPVRGDKMRHAVAFDGFGVVLRVDLELAILRRMRAVAAAGHGNRCCAVAVRHAEMQRGEGAHGKAHDVRALQAERIEHTSDVVARPRLRVALEILGDLRWRIAARVVGDAAVATREEAHLRLPAAMVAAELVHEHDRGAATRFLVIELDAVVGGEGWHNASLR
jgi:hypothetical protein